MAATVDMKLLRATKFPPEFNQKVDMQKVNLQVMKKWIAGKLSDILGSEDDVVTELCFNLIEGSRYPDIKSMQIQLTGFLEKETASFCKEMWNLFLSAQSSPQGVPQELLEAKKLELIQEKIQAEKAADEARLRRDNQERRNREISDIRDRERRDRGFRGGRGGDNWRGGRRGDDRAFGDRRGGFGRGRDRSRSRSRSRSPPRRGSYRGDRDRYVPQNRRGGNRGRSPSRSVSADSRSRSGSRSDDGNRSRRSSRSSGPSRRAGPSRRSPPRYRDSRKRSRSRGRDNYRARNARRKNSSSPSSGSDSGDKKRSPSPKRRRYSKSVSRSRSPAHRGKRRSRSRSSSSSRSRSRDARRRSGRELISRSPSKDRYGRLRRSKTTSRSRSRGGRRSRRRQSSDSPPPRNRSADVSDSEGKKDIPIRHDSAAPKTEESKQTKTPQQQATELREKLLKDQIIKMRRTSISGPDSS